MEGLVSPRLKPHAPTRSEETLAGAGDGGAAEAVNYVEDQLFYFVRLDFGLGKELRRAEAELGHFGVRYLSAGVDDEGKGAEVGLLAEPVYEREAVAIGEGEVENQQIRPAYETVLDGMLARDGVVYADVCIFKAGDDDGGKVGVVFHEQDVGGAFAGVEDAGEFGEQEVLVEGLLHPAGGGGGGVAGGF